MQLTAATVTPPAGHAARRPAGAADAAAADAGVSLIGDRMELTEQIAVVELDGSPCEFGEPKGNWENWRIHFRDKAKISFAHLQLPVAHPIRLVIRFHILESARAHDIDNLLKPLIDALGAAGLFPRTRGGGSTSEWNTQDDWVYAIEAEKELVSSNASTHVEIYVSKKVADLVRTG